MFFVFLFKMRIKHMEALHLEVNEDGSDTTIQKPKIGFGEQKIFDFLPATKIMGQVALDGSTAGVLISNPEMVLARLYIMDSDAEGEPKDDEQLIILRPGQELMVLSELEENKEIWFVFESSTSRNEDVNPKLVVNA